MNKMKRVFSLVLAFAIVLGTFGSVVPAFAETVDAPVATEELRVVPEDVIGTEYEAAVRRLVAFGLIEGYPDGTYKPEREINRAQFAKLLVYALGLDDAVRAAEGQSTGFSDVKAGYWADGYINVASGQNLIKGYPDGTFRPAEKVTYAHALTMLVRALGYQDEFLPGNWPGNYVSKAADVGITKGLRLPAASTEGSKRGIVAQLINNTLDSKVVKVDKYTQGMVDYYETDIPLLKDKLEISKYEDTRVIGDKIVDDGLQDDELRVKFLRDTPGFEKRDRYDRGEIVKDVYGRGDVEVFRFENNVNPREIIGEEVTSYVNDKDRVVHIERENDDKANFDYVEQIKDGEVALVKFDREYLFEDRVDSSRDEKAVVHVFNAEKDRYEEKNIKDLNDGKGLKELTGRVGKFVVRNNKIVYAEIMESTEAPSFMVVMKNDDGKLEGINDVNDEFKKDLRDGQDYDKTLVFNTKGEKLSLKDIKEGNVAYIQEQDYDGDDYAIVVVVQDNKVEGEMGRVKEDRVDLGGKTLKVVRTRETNSDSWKYESVYEVRGTDEVKKWEVSSDWEADMEDAYEEDVVAYTDAVGKIAFLTTESGDSGYKFGIVTRTYADNDRVRIYTTIDGKEGKEIVFKADRETDITPGTVRVLKDNGLDLDYEGLKASQTLVGSAVKFRLNADGEISKDNFYVMPYSARLTMSDDFGQDIIRANDKLNVKYDDQVTYAVSSDNTVVIDAAGVQAKKLKNVNEDPANLDRQSYDTGKMVDIEDFNVTTWKDIKGDNYDAEVEFYIFPKTNKEFEVDGLVFIGKDGASTGSDEEAVYVIDRWKKGDDLIVEYVKYPENKKETRIVDNQDKLALDPDVTNQVVKERAYIGKEKSNGKIELFAKPADKYYGGEDFKVYRKAIITNVRGSYIEVKHDDVTKGQEFLTTGALVYDEDKSKTTSFLKEDMIVDIVTDGIRARVVGYRDMLEDGATKPSDDLKAGEYVYVGRSGNKVILKDTDNNTFSTELFDNVTIPSDVKVNDKVKVDMVTVDDVKYVSSIKKVEDTDKPTDPEDPEEITATVEYEEPIFGARNAYITVKGAEAKDVDQVLVNDEAAVDIKVTDGKVQFILTKKLEDVKTLEIVINGQNYEVSSK